MGIPVLANGNVLHFPDVRRCLKATGADGVMVGEALMFDPRLFSNPAVPLLHGYAFRMYGSAPQLAAQNALIFLELCQKHPIPKEIMKRCMPSLPCLCLGFPFDMVHAN